MAHAIEATAGRAIRSRARSIVAGLVAALVVVGLGSAPALISGFADRSDVHAFHGVEWGALAGVLFAGSMLVVALGRSNSPAVAYVVATLPAGCRLEACLAGSAAILLGLGSLLIQRTGAFAAIPAVLMILWGAAFIAIARSARTTAITAT
jgi:hypothetical protein